MQPCGPPGAVQPFAAGDAGSSTSLAPASVAEDVFLSSSPDDEVKLVFKHVSIIFSVGRLRS